jgi:hypothetical protein
MWYIESGALKAVSYKRTLGEAFIEAFDSYVNTTGHFPDLGVLGAASVQGFDFKPESTIFFITEWALFNAKRIPRMSHDFADVNEHMASLFEDNLPGLEEIKALVSHPQDEILDAEEIDAPNSREDFWDDTIEVPDDYQWPDTADADASTLGS